MIQLAILSYSYFSYILVEGIPSSVSGLTDLDNPFLQLYSCRVVLWWGAGVGRRDPWLSNCLADLLVLIPESVGAPAEVANLCVGLHRSPGSFQCLGSPTSSGVSVRNQKW